MAELKPALNLPYRVNVQINQDVQQMLPDVKRQQISEFPPAAIIFGSKAYFLLHGVNRFKLRGNANSLFIAADHKIYIGVI
jgi:hypothetical protein